MVVATTAWGSASAPAAKLANASVACNSSVTIGVAYPATGDASTIGAFQWDWAQFAQSQWNKGHSMKINLQEGDTVLGPNDQSVPVAHSFASNGAILAVTGPRQPGGPGQHRDLTSRPALLPSPARRRAFA